MRKLTSALSARIAPVLLAITVSTTQAQAASPPSLAQAEPMTPPAALAAECGTQPLSAAGLQACTSRALFKGAARTHARIQRLVLIGQICRKLADDDANAIVRSSASELQEARAELSPQDQDWAKSWQEAVLVGATQSADVSDAVDDAACEQFAKPGGLLTKIMTWSGKQQVIDGVVASPRTFP